MRTKRECLHNSQLCRYSMRVSYDGVGKDHREGKTSAQRTGTADNTKLKQDVVVAGLEMADWTSTLDRECEKSKSDLDGLSKRFAVTSAMLMVVVSTALSVAGSQSLTFEDLARIAPAWVGIQVISMGVAMLYASYETGFASALRKAAASREEPLVNAAWLLDWIVYIGMALGSASALLNQHSAVVIVLFGSATIIFAAAAIAVLRGGFMKVTAETLLGPPSRSKNPIKRIRADIKKAVEWLLATAVVYLAFGGMLVWLMWDSTNWYTVLSISVLATAFVRLLERNFNQYRAINEKRLTLSALERLRLESFTNDEYNDVKIKKEFRQIAGLADDETETQKKS